MKINQIATIGIFFHVLFGTEEYCPAPGKHSLKVLYKDITSSGNFSSEAECKCRILRKHDPGDFVLSLSTDQDVTLKSISPADFKATVVQTLKYFEFENMNVLLSPADVTISFTLEHSSTLLTGTCCCQTTDTNESTTKATTETALREQATTKATTRTTTVTKATRVITVTEAIPEATIVIETTMATTDTETERTTKEYATTTSNSSITELDATTSFQVSSIETQEASTTTSSSYVDAKNPTISCQCICKNLTKEEALKRVKKVISEITVKKQDTKLAKSRKMCAEDKRMSSKAIGVCGIVILCVVFRSIVLVDVMTLCIRIRKL